MDVLTNVEYGLRVKKVDRKERRRRAEEALAAVRLEGYGERRPTPALRRPAAARRARPRAGEPAQGAAARRAARRPRPQAAPGDAARAQADPARRRHHLRVRHARPGGGAVDERPGRGVPRRPGRAGRHPGRALREPGQLVRRRLRRHLQPDRWRRGPAICSARRGSTPYARAAARRGAGRVGRFRRGRAPGQGARGRLPRPDHPRHRRARRRPAADRVAAQHRRPPPSRRSRPPTDRSRWCSTATH